MLPSRGQRAAGPPGGAARLSRRRPPRAPGSRPRRCGRVPKPPSAPASAKTSAAWPAASSTLSTLVMSRSRYHGTCDGSASRVLDADDRDRVVGRARATSPFSSASARCAPASSAPRAGCRATTTASNGPSEPARVEKSAPRLRAQQLAALDELHAASARPKSLEQRRVVAERRVARAARRARRARRGPAARARRASRSAARRCGRARRGPRRDRLRDGSPRNTQPDAPAAEPAADEQRVGRVCVALRRRRCSVELRLEVVRPCPARAPTSSRRSARRFCSAEDTSPASPIATPSSTPTTSATSTATSDSAW